MLVLVGKEGAKVVIVTCRDHGEPDFRKSCGDRIEGASEVVDQAGELSPHLPKRQNPAEPIRRLPGQCLDP